MLLFSKFMRHLGRPRVGTFVVKAKEGEEGLKSVPLNMVVGCILAQARLTETEHVGIKGQSAWSERMGFHSRLLSKYEIGTISLTINHLAYISYYLDIELPVFQKILKDLVLFLAEKHDIYVYMDIDSLPIIGNGFDSNSQKDLSYICIYNWLNLDITFNDRKKIYFDCPNEVSIYELRKYVDGFFNENPIPSFKNNHRDFLLKSLAEKIKNFYYPKLKKRSVENYQQVQNDLKKDENILYQAENYKDSRYHPVDDDRSYNRQTLADETTQIETQDQEVLEPKASHELNEKRLDILVLSNDKSYQVPFLDELSDKKVAIRKLNHASLKIKSEIAILIAKNIEEIHQCNFDLYQISFLIVDQDLDISSCTHKLSNTIVYRKVRDNEETETLLNSLFQSIILSFYTKEYDGLFLDADDLNSVLTFKTNRFLKIENIKEKDIRAKKINQNILDHIKNNGSLVILHKSKHPLGDYKLVHQEFSKITDLLETDGDGEIFYGVSFDSEIIDNEFFIAYSS